MLIFINKTSVYKYHKKKEKYKPCGKYVTIYVTVKRARGRPKIVTFFGKSMAKNVTMFGRPLYLVLIRILVVVIHLCFSLMFDSRFCCAVDLVSVRSEAPLTFKGVSV